MDDLFGRVNRRSELFEPQNGLLPQTSVETNIALGFMAIVPDVPKIPDGPTEEEQTAWTLAKVKPYKLDFNLRT